MNTAFPSGIAEIASVALLAPSQQTDKIKRHREEQAISCWHSSGLLRDTIGRLGGAASGRYHVVIFTKRNPTKCSRRGYVGVGVAALLRRCPNLRLSTQYQIHRQIAAPLPDFRVLVQSQRGARNDDAHVTARHEAISLLRHRDTQFGECSRMMDYIFCPELVKGFAYQVRALP